MCVDVDVCGCVCVVCMHEMNGNGPECRHEPTRSQAEAWHILCAHRGGCPAHRVWLGAHTRFFFTLRGSH
jgi:hypothetical protein